MSECPFKYNTPRVIMCDDYNTEFKYYDACKMMKHYENDCVGEDKCPIYKKGDV